MYAKRGSIDDMGKHRNTRDGLEHNPGTYPGIIDRQLPMRLNQMSNARSDRLPPDGRACSEMMNDSMADVWTCD